MKVPRGADIQKPIIRLKGVPEREEDRYQLPATVIGGQALTLPVGIAWQGISLQLTGLIDSGAAGDVFVHFRLMRTIQQRLNTKIVPVRPLQLAGYNNQCRPSAGVSRAGGARLSFW